jgi:hypothetical protein
VVTEQLRHRAHSFEILVELLSTGYLVSDEVLKAILALGGKNTRGFFSSFSQNISP